FISATRCPSPPTLTANSLPTHRLTLEPARSIITGRVETRGYPVSEGKPSVGRSSVRPMLPVIRAPLLAACPPKGQQGAGIQGPNTPRSLTLGPRLRGDDSKLGAHVHPIDGG